MEEGGEEVTLQRVEEMVGGVALGRRYPTTELWLGGRAVVAGSDEPDWSAMALLMLVTVEMVSSARPPSVSATKGTHSIPDAQQAERLEASLCWTRTCST